MDIESALNTLPDNADDIAYLLFHKGIKGKPINATYCPIANYIKEQTGTAISICRTSYTVGDQSTCHKIDGVSDFIKRFDQGCYPDLVSQD